MRPLPAPREDSTAAQAELLRRAHTALFEHTPDGVLVFDAQHQLVEANGAALLLLGEPGHALMGRPLSALLPEWTPPEPLSPRATAPEGEFVWHGCAGS